VYFPSLSVVGWMQLPQNNTTTCELRNVALTKIRGRNSSIHNKEVAVQVIMTWHILVEHTVSTGCEVLPCVEAIREITLVGQVERLMKESSSAFKLHWYGEKT
jgi:hypothetical protein